MQHQFFVVPDWRRLIPRAVRGLECSGKLWKFIMPFSGPGKFLKKKFLKMAMKNFWIFVLEYSKISKNGFNSVSK